MQSTRIGEFEVHRVAEFEGPFFPPAEFFPISTRRSCGPMRLLGPQLIEPGSAKLNVQLFTPSSSKPQAHDPDRQLPRQRQGTPDAAAIPPDAYSLSRRFRLASGSSPKTSIMSCARICIGHVGWNTRLDNGRWVRPSRCPLCHGRREFSHWQEVHQEWRGYAASPCLRTACCRSCAPANVLVDDDYAFEDGLWFEGAPGHTPGNVVIHARSREETGSSWAT